MQNVIQFARHVHVFGHIVVVVFEFFQREQVLDKPFAEIVKALKLPYKFTPRGMRRTYQDLARAAGIHDAVTRAISGHATPAMQLHYSTARGNEGSCRALQHRRYRDRRERDRSCSSATAAHKDAAPGQRWPCPLRRVVAFEP